MKKWYASKTIRVAGLSLLAALGVAITDDPDAMAWLDLYARWAVPVVFVILRLVTTQGISNKGGTK